MSTRMNIYRQLDQQFELEDNFGDTRELTQEDIDFLNEIDKKI